MSYRSSPILARMCSFQRRRRNTPQYILWRSPMLSSNYNPDVLSCIANLSSDEVFTPPQLANQMLDILPKEIWSDKSITFLDPVCKSVFFQAEDGIRDWSVTGVQTCALPI